MSEIQTIKTILHEMAHQKLHDKDNVPEAKSLSKNNVEQEAESVAYVVCQHYGIDTSDYSFSYVAGWSEGKEISELKSSLDKIRQTAAEFISQIDEKMEVLMAVREQTQEVPKAENPELQQVVNKVLNNLEKKRTAAKGKPSVKCRLQENSEKIEKTSRKPGKKPEQVM